jgi:hypothetical protein
VSLPGTAKPAAFQANRPVAAFTLSVVGLALQVVAGVFPVYMFYVYSRFGGYNYGWPFGMGPWMMFGGGPWAFGVSPFWSAFLVIFAAAVIVLGGLGVMWMNTADAGRIRAGSALVLVASVIAFPTMWGFMIGSLLMFVGSILGLTWQPLVT